ncbi:MAG: hypothetical protein LBG63_00355 [Candidatus Methanoplasma sp.]|jgi:isocitrate/isopropylmalate dehydrogenase|nr:hypothetical protein [Candidatus Methanoplasma sp.]
MTKKVLVLPGDGIGPEVISSAVSILAQAAGGKIEILYGDIGQSAFIRTSKHLPAETMGLAAEADAIIAGGVIGTPTDRTYQNPIRVLKKQLNFYSVVRKFSTLSKRAETRQNIDILLITGNPDTLLNILETESLDGVNSSKFLSRANCKRLFQKTGRLSSAMGRKKITCAHRASMFPVLDGMFVEEFYGELAGTRFLIDDMEVDEAASELIKNPSSIDVLISTDVYGAVFAGGIAGMVGGNYLTPVGSIGDSSGLFEPMHGPNPRSIKDGVVNPTSAILSAAMALDNMGMSPEAEKIRKAVRRVYSSGAVTPDVGGKSTTKEFTDSVVSALKDTG